MGCQTYRIFGVGTLAVKMMVPICDIIVRYGKVSNSMRVLVRVYSIDNIIRTYIIYIISCEKIISEKNARSKKEEKNK